jgi:outer membrane lipoprotein
LLLHEIVVFPQAKFEEDMKMTIPKVHNSLVCIFLLMAVTGCASPIAKTLRQEAAPGVTFPMVFANPDAYVGDTVVWGGSIIRTVNTREGSRLFVLQTVLGLRDKPGATDTSEGRFIAETDRFLDPLVYAKGRLITVAGRVAGKETMARKKADIGYTYPLVKVEQLYLWKKPEPTPPLYWAPYWGPWEYDPFWDFPYYDGFERYEGERREHRGRGSEETRERHGYEGNHDRR